jgi:hypothetical protein
LFQECGIIALVSSRVEKPGFRVHKWIAQGSGGFFFADVLLPLGAVLRRIHIHSGDFVDGLQFEYETAGGAIGLTRFAGGVGGHRRGFEIPQSERLRAISGSFGRFLHSIRFHCSSGASPEYGVSRGERFSCGFGENREFRGIFGREGLYLDSLGIVLENVAGEVNQAGPGVNRMRGLPPRLFHGNGSAAGATGVARKAA